MTSVAIVVLSYYNILTCIRLVRHFGNQELFVHVKRRVLTLSILIEIVLALRLFMIWT